MKIRIDQKVIEQIPGINIAVLVFKNVNNGKKRSNVSQLLRGLVAGKKQELKKEDKKTRINEILRNTIIGTDIMKETRLLKVNLNKITTGKEIDTGNTLTDLVHYLSIKYIIPVLGRDMDQVEKDLEIKFITPKKGQKVEDVDYTKDTKNAVIWLIDSGSMPKEDFEKIPDEFARVIEKYGESKLELKYILNVDNQEADLGYTSQKELEYAEMQKQLAEENALKESILTTDKTPFSDETAEESSFSGMETGPTIKEKLAEAVKSAIQTILTNRASETSDQSESQETESIDINIETPADSTHGDYAVNVAMKLSKILQKSPQDIAREIIKSLPEMDFVEKTEVAGPGFINFFLADEYLKKDLENIIAQRSNYGRLAIGKNKKVVIDYSSPNIAKPLGVHHLLSTIIGQTIADMLRFCSYDVVSVNYLGDWGTQYGKLIYAYKTWGDREIIEKDPLNEMVKIYVRFHEEAEKDLTLEDKAREEFKKLEEGDSENRELLDWMRSASVKELERMYKILGVRFDEYLPESKYPELAKKIVEECSEKGIVVEGEKGALIVKFENDIYPPFILQKSDGTTIYGTRDLASIKDRVENMKADILLYVVDVAQTLHFKQLFETAKQYGFNAENFHHIVFGRMQLPEGRMSTRKGDIILLDEVIKEAVLRTEKLIAEKSPELKGEELANIATAMAVSAIKYNIISQNRETNITFDWDKMLSIEGNSGPYLQYAFARAQSILRKNREQQAANKQSEIANKPANPIVKEPKNKAQTDLFSLTEAAIAAEEAIPDAMEMAHTNAPESQTETPFGNETEKKLMKMLSRFPEYVELATREYKPNLLSTYLFDLSRAFSSFYNEVSVINAATPELKTARIKLVQAVAQVLNNGLKVLGIAVFDRM